MPSAASPDDYTLQVLVLERRDAFRNMARYYVLSVQPSLFGNASLVREWGRIGVRGGRRIELHVDEHAAAEALDCWLRRKVRRGYRLRA